MVLATLDSIRADHIGPPPIDGGIREGPGNRIL